jgi:hypothetical protein
VEGSQAQVQQPQKRFCKLSCPRTHARISKMFLRKNFAKIGVF